jgi:hypothetical protein
MSSRPKNAARKPISQSLKTDNFVGILLVDDPAIIAECASKIRSKGGLFVCHRCTKVNSRVVAILVVSEDPDNAMPFVANAYAICPKELITNFYERPKLPRIIPSNGAYRMTIPGDTHAATAGSETRIAPQASSFTI